MVPTRSYTASNKLCFLIASIYHDHQVCMRRGGADDRLAARSKVAGQPMSFLRSRSVSLLDSTLTRTYTVRGSCASITQLGRYLICEAAGRTAAVSLDGMQTNAMRLERWSMPTASWLRGCRSGRSPARCWPEPRCWPAREKLYSFAVRNGGLTWAFNGFSSIRNT